VWRPDPRSRPRPSGGRLWGIALAALLAPMASGQTVAPGVCSMGDAHCGVPRWTTTGRLLKPGEAVEFRFVLPEGAEGGDLTIFPRYLERARPGRAFVAGGSLDWLDKLEHETIPLHFEHGRAEVTYRPREPGSYLARWTAGGEAFYRYFSVIEDDWIVLRFSTFGDLEAEPTLHATGIPLDYRLPVDRFEAGDPLFRKFLSYHRHFGDTIIPHFPDTPELTVEERVKAYGEGLARVRALLPDPNEARSVRVEMHHDLDPGYTETFMRLGINDHCGLNEANAKPWLGMPEFPYFSSPLDCRKPNQAEGGSVVAHQWDFCGGWHFLGPVSWHYKVAEGNWSLAEECLRQGAKELANLAALSGHPAFAVPLYDGFVGPGYPNPSFEYALGDPRPFHGAIGDVFVVGRALTPDEIARVMGGHAADLQDPLAVWPLDEGKGDLVRDASGHGRSGKLLGQPRWVGGRSGAALSLDGEDDCVVMDAPLTIDTIDFTIGCWVKPEGAQHAYANLLSSHNDEAGRHRRGISLEQAGDQTNRLYLIAGMGDEWVGTHITTQLQAGVWQHFAVAREGGKLRHYLNGRLSAEGDVPPVPFAPATDCFRMGDWARGGPARTADMLRFIERYQHFMAFELPKRHKLAYARSIDLADYCRRHFRVTPRTVFVSKTNHVLYDRWWLCNWGNFGMLVPRERIPWDTRISNVMHLRDTVHPFKDPLSHEYLLIEDQRRSIRFERECPNPIWWFDYAKQEEERGPQGSSITHVRTPDVDIRRSETHRDGVLTITLRMLTEAEFPDYAVALWNVPPTDPARIETNAKEIVRARNTDGETHLVLFFDLRPGAEVWVRVRHA